MNREFERLDALITSKKKEIDVYVKRKNVELAPFVKRRTQVAAQLYKHMTDNDLDVYNGISIERVKPKEKQVKIKVSRDQQIATLRKMGIRNPVACLEEIGL